jgi:hypothetical protein
MKFLKIALLVIGGIVVLLAILFGIYLLVNRQGVIESSDVGEPDFEKRVLIASQGSSFKNALVDELSTYLKEKKVYLKIVDVTALTDIPENNWDAVILIHTTEMNKLQPDVKAYLDRIQDYGRVILITTSGPGTWKTDEYNVDIITSASKQEELPGLAKDVIKRLDLMLRE